MPFLKNLFDGVVSISKSLADVKAADDRVDGLLTKPPYAARREIANYAKSLKEEEFDLLINVLDSRVQGKGALSQQLGSRGPSTPISPETSQRAADLAEYAESLLAK